MSLREDVQAIAREMTSRGLLPIVMACPVCAKIMVVDHATLVRNVAAVAEWAKVDPPAYLVCAPCEATAGKLLEKHRS